jgi:hypothetical protein
MVKDEHRIRNGYILPDLISQYKVVSTTRYELGRTGSNFAKGEFFQTLQD